MTHSVQSLSYPWNSRSLAKFRVSSVSTYTSRINACRARTNLIKGTIKALHNNDITQTHTLPHYVDWIKLSSEIEITITKKRSANIIIYFTDLGVYFTKFVRDICLQLGINGWVKNSKKGTILGQMEGPKALVDQM